MTQTIFYSHCVNWCWEWLGNIFCNLNEIYDKWMNRNKCRNSFNIYCCCCYCFFFNSKTRKLFAHFLGNVSPNSEHPSKQQQKNSLSSKIYSVKWPIIFFFFYKYSLTRSSSTHWLFIRFFIEWRCRFTWNIFNTLYQVIFTLNNVFETFLSFSLQKTLNSKWKRIKWYENCINWILN